MRKSLLFVVLVIVVVALIRTIQPIPKRSSASGTEPKFTYDLESRPVTTTLSGPLFGDEEVVRVAAIPWLWQVNLSNSRVTGRGLEALSGLPELKSLDLSRTTLSNEDFTAVTKLTTLSELLLNDCPWLTDEHLHSLIELQNLQKLELSSAGVTAAGIGGLSALPKLKHLTVGHCATLDDSSVEHLVRLSSLDDLELPNTDLSIRAFLELRERLLGVLRLKIGESPLEMREVFQRLRFLPGNYSFSYMPTRDGPREPLRAGDLAIVGKWTHLKSLYLEGEITDAMLLELGALPQLESIFLGSTQITDDGLRFLATCPRLQRLSMFQTVINGSGLSHLKHTPNLIDISVCTKQGDVLEHFAPLLDLVELVIRAPITDEQLEQLPVLSKLRSLCLNGSQVRGPGIASLAKQPSLTSLAFRSALVEDSARIHIASLTSLRWVVLRESGMTEDGKARLRELRPDLKVD